MNFHSYKPTHDIPVMVVEGVGNLKGKVKSHCIQKFVYSLITYISTLPDIYTFMLHRNESEGLQMPLFFTVVLFSLNAAKKKKKCLWESCGG